MRSNKIRRISLLIKTLLMLILSFISVQVYAKEIDSDTGFWVEYVDVGQGDCAIIQCDGHYMMIDGGPSSASSIVYTILKDKGIKKLDVMIATHPDEDHIGGLSGALNYASVDKVYCSVTSHDTKTFSSLQKYVKKQNKEIEVPKAGIKFDLGTAEVKIVGPTKKASDTNNNSLVVRIVYGDTAFIFMGDAENEEESDIISSKTELDCDVLKVGHHGSDSSTSSKLIKAVKPEYAVISVGKDNKYDHPTQDTLDRLTAAKAKIYRTDLQGDITCTSDGKKLEFTTEKKSNDEKLGQVGKAKESSANAAASIPAGTTYVLNTNSKKFHVTTCNSVSQMAAKNTEYSTMTAAEIVSMGYDPCGNCKPSVGTSTTNKETVKQTQTETTASTKSYVLNTNTKKFHNSSCSSVGDMSAKNRKDVQSSRDDIIKQGYVPCKRCNP